MSAHDPLITLRQMADFIKAAQGLASGKSLDAMTTKGNPRGIQVGKKLKS